MATSHAPASSPRLLLGPGDTREPADAGESGTSIVADRTGQEDHHDRVDGGLSEVVADLGTTVDRLLARDPDEMSEPELLSELSGLERQVRRLGNRQARLAAALTTRRARAARRSRPDDPRAGDRAARLTKDQLGQELNWSPTESSRHIRLGKHLEGLPTASQAADSGALSPTHLQILARTLDPLVGDARTDAEATLVEAGKKQDAVAFGRTCRRLLAEIDHEAAADAERRRVQRRRASVTTTPDGMTTLYASLAGLDGETVQTAVHAFRSMDPPGIQRTAEQRTADALVEICRVALRAGEAPTNHGVRPHVSVTIDHGSLLSGSGAAETTFVGPLPFSEVRRLLADAGVARILLDRDGLPVESGPEVRTVPAAVWRAIKHRDGGCIGEGCTMPVYTCDVMHIGVRHAQLGTLTIETAALGCRLHHRNLDLHGWIIEHVRGRPVLRPPPRAGRPPP